MNTLKLSGLSRNLVAVIICFLGLAFDPLKWPHYEVPFGDSIKTKTRNHINIHSSETDRVLDCSHDDQLSSHCQI
jgi:hypothetical protein